MTFSTSLLLVVVAALFFGLIRTKKTNPKKAIIVQKPKLGLLNLSGEKYLGFIQKDKMGIQSIFDTVESMNTVDVLCDVLFIYGDIDSNGMFKGCEKTLREIIRDTGAVVIVVATENNVDSYIKAAKDVGYGKANLVMTLDRKGTYFQSFFANLFNKMMEGIPMPIAWVELAPQGPNGGGDETPGTIFSAELGQVLFLYEPK